MTNEEKYKDALEKARAFYETKSPDCLILESIFPELRESDDEKIRKECIKYLDWEYQHCTFDEDKMKIEKCVSWLEKQGEQNKQQLYDVPDTSIKDSEEVASRMKYIDENLKPIAEFVMDYASWDLRKDEWNHPVATVPLFRVLDALVQKGKQYSEEYSVVDNNTEPKFEVGDVMRTLQEAADNITSGLPVVVHIGKKYYHCTNELIAIKNQDDYEYPPTNRRQKPDVSLEPKFKVGDWIVDDRGNIACIADTIKKKNGTVRYHLKFTDGGTSYPYTCFVDNDFHKFTIEDAKDGDVLATEYFIFIFKNVDKDNGVHYYCHYEIGQHEDDEQFGVALPQSLMGRVDNNFSHYSPASKEQHDLLFQKIKEAGYEWDSKMKQLIKLY